MTHQWRHAAAGPGAGHAGAGDAGVSAPLQVSVARQQDHRGLLRRHAHTGARHGDFRGHPGNTIIFRRLHQEMACP